MDKTVMQYVLYRFLATYVCWLRMLIFIYKSEFFRMEACHNSQVPGSIPVETKEPFKFKSIWISEAKKRTLGRPKFN